MYDNNSLLMLLALSNSNMLTQSTTANMLENQIAQCNCILSQQQQELSLRQQTQAILSNTKEKWQDYAQPVQNPAWTKYAAIKNPYYLQNYCCENNTDTKPQKTNCINCGASLKGKHRCDYCGTYNK